MIEAQSICKSFGNTQASDHISLKVSAGEIYGFLGLNGAGKTTLIRVLLGMVKQDSGQIRLFDQVLSPDFKYWNQIGYLVETPYSYPNLNVKENLEVICKLRFIDGQSFIPEILHKLKLDKYAQTKAGALSLGNQQRLGLAKALIHKPKLLILDEPINGLDPEGIVEVRELLLELAEMGSTIFISSHILSEISKIAHRIGIIHDGRLIKEISIKDLHNDIIKKLYIETNDNARASSILAEAGFNPEAENLNRIHLQEESALATPENITTMLSQAGLPPKQIYTWVEDLEMYFLRTIKMHSK